MQPFNDVMSSNSPRFPQRFRAQPVRLLVTDELILYRVIVDLAVEEQRDVRCMTGNVRVARSIRVRPGRPARLDAIEKVADVEVCRIAGDFGLFADQ